MNKPKLVSINKLKTIVAALLIAIAFTGIIVVGASYAENKNTVTGYGTSSLEKNNEHIQITENGNGDIVTTSELSDLNIESDCDISLKDIELHDGVTADIHLKVFVNEMNPSSGEIIFAVPGGMHTANTYKPFAEALFNDESGRKVSMVIAIDMPGHGKSTVFPANEFGNLTYDDNVRATYVSLERLNNHLHIEPRTVIGHSMGGIVVQMMQQVLKNEGTNLKKAFNIKTVVLLAPAPPREIDFSIRDSFDTVSLANNFMIDGLPSYEEELLAKFGSHFAIPDDLWSEFFFIKYDDGFISPKAPSPEEVSEFGYNAPEMASLLQIVGYAIIGSPDLNYPYWEPEDFLLDNDLRPSIDRGIFGPSAKTRLYIVGYAQDTWIRPDECKKLYEYLTGDGHKKGFIVVEGDEMHDSVHDLHVSDPEYLLDSIRSN